jgi:hypothetical protein
MGNERFGKIEGELVADRADKNPGMEQFIIGLSERMGEDTAVSFKINFVRAVILIG